MHEVDSRIRLNVRHAILAMLIFGTMVVLWNMWNEQDKIERCTKLISANNKKDLNSDQDCKRPIQVVIQNPFTSDNTSIQQTQQKATPVREDIKWDYNWDKKQWKNKSEAIGVPARTIVLVRHGKYDFHTGLLDDTGKQQANYTGLRLQQMGMRFSRLVHSPLDRARQTAEIILPYLQGVPVQVDSMIEEGGPVPPDPTISYWSLPERQYHVDGPRLESAFRKYFYRANKSQKEQSYELLVGHANIFRYFILRALQLERSAWMRLFISHASITLLHVNSDSTVSVTRFGDSGHLPHKMVTF